MNNNKNEYKKIEPLNDEQTEKTSGVDEQLEYWIVEGCSHTNRTPTNEYREDPFFIF